MVSWDRALFGDPVARLYPGGAPAKHEFAGREFVFGITLSGVLIPGAILALPLFLLLSKIGLTYICLACWREHQP